MISVNEALDSVKFSSEEQRTLSRFEGVFDSIITNRFDGTPMKIELNDVIAPKIVCALQRKFEAGGWRVGYTSTPVATFQLIPTTTTQQVYEPKPKTLPPIRETRIDTGTAAKGKRLLVRLPTRNRPLRAVDVARKYLEMAGVPVTVEVIMDYDDPTMNSTEVIQRLVNLGCVVTVGAHKSKIEAVNGGRVSEWDVLLMASDDMIPVVDGYGKRVLDAMEQHFPLLDGLIYFDDGFQGENLCTLPIFGRRLYDQFGYVYHPSYISLFSDAEQTDLLREMKRIVYIDERIIEHHHHVWGKSTNDALYQRNDAHQPIDDAMYNVRRNLHVQHSQFAFEAPPMWLSICIATIPSRRVQLEHLVDHLFAQMRAYPREVEIVIDSRENVSIGDKRQALLERAVGHFVAFVDDDDWVSHDYVSRIIETMRSNPTADCLALHGVMTTAGTTPQRFYHSLTNKWVDGEVLLRAPNHLNPIRRQIALQVGFRPISYAEDHDYSQRVTPLLKREASTGDAPLYHYWYMPQKIDGAKAPSVTEAA